MTARTQAAPGRANRLNVTISGVLRVAGGEYPCETRNISRTGALLSGDFPVPLQGPVDLTLKGTVTVPEVRLRARVARLVRPGDGTEPALAVQFDDLEPDVAGALETLFARLIEDMRAPSCGLEDLKPGAPPHEIRSRLASIPLAARIGMAARAPARELDLLRQDTNPAVLDVVAHNPNLTEAEVLALLSSPFLAPRTLEHIAVDPRWASVLSVRTAVVTHARTPPGVATELVSKLPAGVLHRILRTPGLNPTVRERIGTKLTRGR